MPILPLAPLRSLHDLIGRREATCEGIIDAAAHGLAAPNRLAALLSSAAMP
jgi:hypothetical protein